MLTVLEAERAMMIANLSFATNEQGMGDEDRDRFLGSLKLKANPGHVATADEIQDAGITIIYEEPESAPEPVEGSDGAQVVLPPGVQA